MKCGFCGKDNELYQYCDWDCRMRAAITDGGQKHLPNGLPVKAIKADGSMYEHEHGDHPDYKFPVDIEYVGPILPVDEEDYKTCCNSEGTEKQIREFRSETHALIYSDYSVALTMYEYCYAMWSLHDGALIGGSLWERGLWKLSQASIEKIIFMKRTA